MDAQDDAKKRFEEAEERAQEIWRLRYERGKRDAERGRAPGESWEAYRQGYLDALKSKR